MWGVRASRFVVLAAGAAVAAAGLPAHASPAPTVTTTTYLPTGAALPMTTVSAAWSRVQPGCSGRLEITGPTVSGTTTVVRGEFVSRWFRPRRGLVLQLTAARGGDHRVRPFDESYLVSIRIRSAHHGWSQWQPLSATIKPDLPLSLLFTVGTRLAMSLWEPVAGPRQVPLQQVQMRIVDRITSTATVDDVFTIHNGC